MRWLVSGAPIPLNLGLPFAAEVANAAMAADIPPCLLYAIKWNETSSSSDSAKMQDGAIGDKLPNGENAGHGIFQLTDSWPADWRDPLANAAFACRVYIAPALTFWNAVHGVTGDDLVRCVAAAYNEGVGGSWSAHMAGDVDKYDTDHYGLRALDNYHRLIAGQHP